MKKEIQIHRIATDIKETSAIMIGVMPNVMVATQDKDIINDIHDWMKFGKPHHLYVTIPQDIEPIKEGDWCLYNKAHNSKNPIWELFQCSKIESEEMHPISKGKLLLWLRKIIATTDTLKLQVESFEFGSPQEEHYMPQFDPLFIKEYCDKGGIDKALVEYELGVCLEILGDAWVDCKCGTGECKNGEWKLKLNSDNTITIYSLKEKMYSRDDMLKAWDSGVKRQHVGWEKTKEQWIKENL